MAMTESDTEVPSFSERVKAMSWGAHGHAEQARFMQELLGGRLPLERYAQLVAQHRFAYAVLEEAAAAMAEDPIGGAFVFPELTRLPALDADLRFLLGDDWAEQVAPVPATLEYCDRMRAQCFGWSGGYVAHHYVRYMGDLSGGQVVRRILEGVYDLPDRAGVGFYVFDRIDDPVAFKAEYRARLDAAAWVPDEQERVAEEIMVAYRLNTEVLDQLG